MTRKIKPKAKAASQPAKPAKPAKPERPVIRMPTAREDAAIRAAAKADPDAQPLTPLQLRKMVPLRLPRPLRLLRGRAKVAEP